MAFCFDKYIFFHIPKTGGTSLRTAVNSVNSFHTEIGHTHCAPLDVYPQYKKMISFCIVRHPMAWYESFYKFRCNEWKTKSYRPKVFFDVVCRAQSFEEFIQKVLVAFPFGYVASLYSRYVPFVKEIIHIENLYPEFNAMLKRNNSRPIGSNPYVNRSPTTVDLTISAKTKAEILKREAGVMQYLGYQ